MHSRILLVIPKTIYESFDTIYEYYEYIEDVMKQYIRDEDDYNNVHLSIKDLKSIYDKCTNGKFTSFDNLCKAYYIHYDEKSLNKPRIGDYYNILSHFPHYLFGKSVATHNESVETKKDDDANNTTITDILYNFISYSYNYISNNGVSALQESKDHTQDVLKDSVIKVSEFTTENTKLSIIDGDGNIHPNYYDKYWWYIYEEDPNEPYQEDHPYNIEYENILQNILEKHKDDYIVCLDYHS